MNLDGEDTILCRYYPLLFVIAPTLKNSYSTAETPAAAVGSRGGRRGW
jgi:hypothetical protein